MRSVAQVDPFPVDLNYTDYFKLRNYFYKLYSIRATILMNKGGFTLRSNCDIRAPVPYYIRGKFRKSGIQGKGESESESESETQADEVLILPKTDIDPFSSFL